MGGYSHGRGLKSQPTNGVKFVIRFSIVSDILKSNFSDTFLEMGCDGGPHTDRLEDLGESQA